jgi:hypothetical protein
MLLNGINQLEVKVTLRNPMDHNDLLDYYIVPNDSKLAKDWIYALKKILSSNNLLEKNYCFMGFPKSARTLEYLCDTLNRSVEIINKFDFTQHGLENYIIEEWFHPNTVRFSDTYSIEGTMLKPGTVDGTRRTDIGLYAKHSVLNQLHNHFERMQGTVGKLSPYYRAADHETKYAIRQLNIICHEMESLILSQRKLASTPEWVRPSQITTFLHAERYELKDEHREAFVTNSYDRKFGHVYMHWAQIGKTLMEVFRDEGAPELTDTVCEAITSLEYYSGEFDVEWAKDVTRANKYPWVEKLVKEFTAWLVDNGLDPQDPKLSLGYLPLGHIDLDRSFGTTDMFSIWDQLSTHLDIYSIEVDGVKNTFEYCWTDEDYKQQQIDMMRPGYDFSSRG